MTDARILTEYVEATAASDVAPRRLGTLYMEATTQASAPRQLGTVYAETAAVGIPARQLDTVYVETAAIGVPFRQLNTIYVEVMSPSHRPYRGWGVSL